MYLSFFVSRVCTWESEYIAHNRCADRHSPASHHRHLLKKQPNLWKQKKDVGVVSLRAYPNHQAFALPL